jgi:hypothetical protein
MSAQPHLCERARSWASLRADGELSELESALLDAHLKRCPACRRFARGAEEVAWALRTVRQERPAPLVVAPPRAAGSGGYRLRFAAAALVVLTVGLLAAFTGPRSGPSAGKPVAMVAAVESPDRLRELRRPLLVEQGRLSLPPRFRRLVAEPV